MKIAILGATGAVGQMMMRVLEEREFPADEVVLLASARSAGRRIPWRGREWTVMEPSPEAFEGCTLALFSAGASRSNEWAQVAADAGAVVVDNSSAWRMDPEVPLVVPEVNAAQIHERSRGIIANPNCVTIQLVLVLEGIRRAGGLRRVVASTYQAVSGAGAKGVEALRAELAGGESAASPFDAPIAGNVIPSIGGRDPAGWTEEEVKIRNETRKIIGLPELAVAATCVRVPVEVGHSVAATVETERPIDLETARAALAAMPGVIVEDGTLPVPRDVAGNDVVRIGRLRSDPDLDRVLHFWVVGDNLRKGAATNTVQIAELLLRG